MASVENLSTCIESYGHDLSWLQNYHHKIPEDVLHFCYLGQICHDKGVHILIEAFLNLEKTAHDVVLDIWGGLDSDSPYVRRIHELAASSNNIHLHGGFSRTQLADVLSQSDVVVVPSIWYENNPLVIQEAFAAQVPVIATDLGGMSEFVQHGANGLLFESDNVTDLLNQMQRVVNEPSLLSQLRKGILPVKTIEQEVAQLMVIYEQSLGDRKTKHDTNA
jgi:glycosyltransferase involved in cell wall biosynthesis